MRNGVFSAKCAGRISEGDSCPVHVTELCHCDATQGHSWSVIAQRNAIQSQQRIASREGLRGSPWRAAKVRFLLKHTRKTVKYRENLRLARTRAFGFVKRIFRRLGVLLAEQRVLAAPEDVFYLGVDEVIGAVRGCGLTRDLQALVRLRQAEFQGYREQREPPGRILSHGIVAARPFPRAEVEVHEGGLSGIGASPGRGSMMGTSNCSATR
mgnify:CR=1 FL=1